MAEKDAQDMRRSSRRSPCRAAQRKGEGSSAVTRMAPPNWRWSGEAIRIRKSSHLLGDVPKIQRGVCKNPKMTQESRWPERICSHDPRCTPILGPHPVCLHHQHHRSCSRHPKAPSNSSSPHLSFCGSIVWAQPPRRYGRWRFLLGQNWQV